MAVRRRAALLAAICAAAFLTPAAEAAPATVYSVTASASASVEVTFARAVTLEPTRTTVSGGLSYAGYYVEPLAAPQYGIGMVSSSDFEYPRLKPFVVPLGRGEAAKAFVHERNHVLRPGRYRLHVLGDAPTTVRLALRGAGASRSLRATRRSPFVGRVEDVTSAPPAPVAREELPAAVSGITVVAAYVAYRGVYPQGTGMASPCLRADAVPDACHAGPAPGHPDFDNFYTAIDSQWSLPVPHVRGGYGHARYYWTAPPGEYTASYVAAFDVPLDRVAIATFTLAV